MNIYVDEREYLDLPPSADAPAVLEAVSSELARSGRVIMGIKVDGLSMDEAAFAAVTGGLSVHFTSQLLRELVSDSLSEALGYIPRLIKGFEEIAMHFEGHELVQAQSKLADAAEGLDWCIGVFWKSSALLDVTSEKEEAGLTELKDALTESVTLLGTLYEQKKHLQMALCIRQKLLPEVRKFTLYIQKLHELSTSIQ